MCNWLRSGQTCRQNEKPPACFSFETGGRANTSLAAMGQRCTPMLRAVVCNTIERAMYNAIQSLWDVPERRQTWRPCRPLSGWASWSTGSRKACHLACSSASAHCILLPWSLRLVAPRPALGLCPRLARSGCNAVARQLDPARVGVCKYTA